MGGGLNTFWDHNQKLKKPLKKAPLPSAFWTTETTDLKSITDRSLEAEVPFHKLD